MTTETIERRPRRGWTPSDDAEVNRLASDGWTDAEIANHLGRDVKLIGRNRQDMNIALAVPPAQAAMMSRVNTRNRGARA